MRAKFIADDMYRKRESSLVVDQNRDLEKLSLLRFNIAILENGS